MGLDITAYRGLTKAVGDEGKDPNYPDGADYANGWFSINHNPDFPTRCEDVSEGRYRAEDEFGFRAGSYSGYTLWRETLAAMFGYKAGRSNWDIPDTGAFVELINFSDCEGTLGTSVCAKLAADFATHQPTADAHSDEWFRVKYADWRKACEMAAQGGCIVFH